MNTRRKFAILTLLFALMTALACQKADLPDPESGRSDREARSALPDTTSVPEIPQKPAPVSLADEKFLIRALSPDSLKGEALFLNFISGRNLGCIGANYISYTITQDENTGSEIGIGDLIFVNECKQPDSPAAVSILINLSKKNETKLGLRIGEKKYQGKITRSDGRLLIEWPDDSQFKFSDKVLNF